MTHVRQAMMQPATPITYSTSGIPTRTAGTTSAGARRKVGISCGGKMYRRGSVQAPLVPQDRLLMLRKPVFRPDQPYDCKGIFTGCFYPTGPAGECDQLSIFYTSVNHLPISWDQAYTRGCEGLSLITSADGGQTCACLLSALY